MRAQDVIVEVRDKNLVRRGQIERKYLDVEATLVDSGVGEWRVRLPVEHPMARLLLTPGYGLVATHVDPTVGGLWSGPTSVPERQASIVDPRGIATIEGVTDDVLLWKHPAYPQPSNPDVSTQTVGWDVRTGNAETVMRAFVNANIGPGAPVSRRIGPLTLAANLNRGASVTKSARFDKLGELLREIATVAGLGFRIVQVGTVLELQVYARRDRTGTVRLDVFNGTLSSQTVKTTPPELTRAIVLGQGEGADRTIIMRSTVESLAAEAEWGIWGRAEEVIDQRQTDDPLELNQAGDERLAEAGRTQTTVTAVPSDDQTMRAFIDWRVGDRVALVIDGQEPPVTVETMQVLIGPKGVKVGAGIGEVTGWKPPASRAQVAAVSRRVEALERNAEAATTVDVADVVGAAWTSFVPVLSATGSNPTGYTATGRYHRVGREVTVEFQIVMGAGAGSGDYRISLPIPAFVYGVTSGFARMFDASTGNAHALVRGAVASSTTASFQVTATFGGTLTNVGAAVPWAWAAGDIIDGTITYEAAA